MSIVKTSRRLLAAAVMMMLTLAAPMAARAQSLTGGRFALLDANGQVQSGNALNLYGSLTPLATSYLGNISSGVSLPFVSSANLTLTYGNARSPLFAYDTLTAPVLKLPCFYVTAASTNTEHTFGATITYQDVRIEDQAGNLTRATFSGSTTGTCTDGSILTSDPITLSTPIPGTPQSPTLYWVRLYLNSTGGLPLHGGHINIDNGAAFAYGTSGTGSDLAGATGTFASTGNVYPNSGNMILPLAVLQQTKVRSFCAGPGTSRTEGTNDGYSGTNASLGNLARSLDQFAPTINLGVGSDRTDWFLASDTNRVALMQFCSDAIIEDTINDVTVGLSASTIETNLTTIRGLFPATTKVSLITTEPVSTPTALSVTSLVANGNGLTASVADTRSLFRGEIVTISGATPSTDNGPCEITSLVSNPSFSCVSSIATGTATATGTVTYTTDWQDQYQTPTANAAVLTAVNTWKRTVPSGFYRTIELANAVSTGLNSTKWLYGAGFPNGGLTADGTHCKDFNCYKFIANLGVINPRILN